MIRGRLPFDAALFGSALQRDGTDRGLPAGFPNDSAYYYVSDSGRHRWLEAARAAHEIRPLCNADKREPTA